MKKTREERIAEVARDLCSYGKSVCTCVERDGHCTIPMSYATKVVELNYRKFPCNIGDPCYPRPRRKGGEI